MRSKVKISVLIKYIVLCSVALIMLYPLFWVFLSSLKENNEMETKLEPLFSTYLSQFSEEHYKDTWLTTGLFLKKGENIFYLNGKDQTFPYRIALKITFLESEKIEKVILYPEEVSSSDK